MNIILCSAAALKNRLTNFLDLMNNKDIHNEIYIYFDFSVNKLIKKTITSVVLDKTEQDLVIYVHLFTRISW